MIIHDGNLHSIETFPTDQGGNRVLPVISKPPSGFVEVTLDVQNLALTQAFILISLRDTGKWKHTLKNQIQVDRVGINVNPSSSYRGDVNIGFLSNTAANRGDFHILKTFHFDQAGNGLQAFLNLVGVPWICSTNNWFGQTIANDSTWGNSVQLIGPDGYMHFGTYDGDLVMKVTRTAGNVDVGVVVGYHTI